MELNESIPRGDRTGPRGFGPKTGRAAGYCAGYPVPGYMNPTPGFGRGFGRGWGQGFRRGFGRGWWGYAPSYPYEYPPTPYPPRAPPQSPQQELAAIEDYKKQLKAEKADLDQEMKEIVARIDELKAKLEQSK